MRWLGPDPVELAGVEIWAPVGYEGPARALVRALKFRGALAIADSMAAQITARVPGRLLAGAELVPVPLHPARFRRRGFNQAERIARAIGRRAGLAVSTCLERPVATAPQVGRTRSDRATAMRGAIALRAGATPPQRALIVDDVATTGATLAACAAALRATGTWGVVALAYARTPPR